MPVRRCAHSAQHTAWAGQATTSRLAGPGPDPIAYCTHIARGYTPPPRHDTPNNNIVFVSFTKASNPASQHQHALALSTKDDHSIMARPWRATQPSQRPERDYVIIMPICVLKHYNMHLQDSETCMHAHESWVCVVHAHVVAQEGV